jgi:hypothetical protein
MARLIRAGSGDWQRREGLSDFQIAIDEAAYFKNSKPLAMLLRTDLELTKEDRLMLATFVEGKLRRKVGAPKGKRRAIRLDWLASGARKYCLIRERWRAIKGRKLKFRRRKDGVMVSVRPELCQRIAARLGHSDKAEMLESYVNRPQSRR